MQQRVEYKVIWANLDRNLEDDLNEAAADGWHVVQTIGPPDVRGASGITTSVPGVILEREIPTKPGKMTVF